MLDELLKYLGMDPEKVKDSAAFKTEFTKGFYNKKSFEDQKSPEFRELFPVMIGKFAGKNTTKLQKKLKDKGFDLGDDEIKDKDFEEVFDLAFDKVFTGYDGKIKTLTEDSGKNQDQKVKEWEDKYVKLESKFKDTDKLLKETGTKLTEKEQAWNTEKKTIVLSTKKADAFKGIKWSDEVKKDPLKQKGFLNELEENLSFDFDDKDSFIVKSKKTGERIPSKTKNGEFLSPEEAIQGLALEHKVWAENPHGGGSAEKRTFNAAKTNLQNQNGQGIFVGQEAQGGRAKRVSGSIPQNEA